MMFSSKFLMKFFKTLPSNGNAFQRHSSSELGLIGYMGEGHTSDNTWERAPVAALGVKLWTPREEEHWKPEQPH